MQDVKVSTSTDGKEIYVLAPSNGYTVGQSYTLYITNNVKSENDSTLSEKVKMVFTIK